MTAGPPAAVQVVSASYAGDPGNATYYYWVIAQYTGGASPPAMSNEVRNVGPLGGGNTVTIGWSAAPGASTYDVLRTTAPTLPASCTCAVATGVAGLTATDNGAALSPYTLSSAGPATAEWSLDNATGDPKVKLYINQNQVFDLNASGGLTLPGELILNHWRTTEIATPSNWTTLDGRIPHCADLININSFDTANMAGDGLSWPVAAACLFSNVPSGTPGGSGAGVAALLLGARSEIGQTGTGRPAAGARIEGHVGNENGNVWGITLLVSDTSKNPFNSGAVSYASPFHIGIESDQHITNAGSGAGLGIAANVTSFVTRANYAGSNAHFAAFQDPFSTIGGTCYSGQPFQGTCGHSTFGFYSHPGAAQYALYGSAYLSGNNQPSQFIALRSTSAGGASQAWSKQVTAAYAVTDSASAGASYEMKIGGVTEFQLTASALTLSSYAGSGNGFACFDANGAVYRSATACN